MAASVEANLAPRAGAKFFWMGWKARRALEVGRKVGRNEVLKDRAIPL